MNDQGQENQNQGQEYPVQDPNQQYRWQDQNPENQWDDNDWVHPSHQEDIAQYQYSSQKNYPEQQPQIYYHDQPYGDQQFTHKQNLDLLTDKKVPHWRIWLISLAFAALHIIVLNFAAFVVGIIMFATSGATTEIEVFNLLMSSDLQNWACIVMFIICVPIYVFFLKNRNKKYRGSVALKKPETISSLTMLIAAFGSLGLVTGLLMLLEFLGEYIGFIANWIQNYVDLTEMIVSEDGSLILQIIATVIMVPIAEELLFRGIIQGELNLRYSPRIVVLVQAILFGIFHMNPIQSMYTFIPGLLLGIAYYYTGNLIIPIMMHIIFNLIGGVFNVIFPENILQWINYAELGVGIFSLIIVILFFVKAKPGREHKLQWEYSIQDDVQK